MARFNASGRGGGREGCRRPQVPDAFAGGNAPLPPSLPPRALKELFVELSCCRIRIEKARKDLMDLGPGLEALGNGAFERELDRRQALARRIEACAVDFGSTCQALGAALDGNQAQAIPGGEQGCPIVWQEQKAEALLALPSTLRCHDIDSGDPAREEAHPRATTGQVMQALNLLRATLVEQEVLVKARMTAPADQ